MDRRLAVIHDNSHNSHRAIKYVESKGIEPLLIDSTDLYNQQFVRSHRIYGVPVTVILLEANYEQGRRVLGFQCMELDKIIEEYLELNN